MTAWPFSIALAHALRCTFVLECACVIFPFIGFFISLFLFGVSFDPSVGSRSPVCLPFKRGRRRPSRSSKCLEVPNERKRSGDARHAAQCPKSHHEKKFKKGHAARACGCLQGDWGQSLRGAVAATSLFTARFYKKKKDVEKKGAKKRWQCFCGDANAKK